MMTTEQIMSILAEYTTKYGGQYNLATPFIMGEYAWATNGAICVRTALTDDLRAIIEPIMTGGRKLPDTSLFGGYFDRDQYETTPIDLPGNAAGYTCPRCKASGDSCWICGGEGGWAEVSVAVGDMMLGGRYLSTMWRHGVRQIYRPLDKNPTVYFETGPIQGCLMKMTRG